MAALRALTPDEVYCLRNNELQVVLAETLVPGDIVHIKAGEKVPADLRVLSSIDLKVNNASLTGENVDIKLTVDANSETLYEAKNIARMGCNFTCGNGVCIVFATGDTTFFGSIAKSTTTIKRPESCLTKELKRLVYSK
jgi:sodium/potassium-transporting ATPase subunit alpha